MGGPGAGASWRRLAGPCPTLSRGRSSLPAAQADNLGTSRQGDRAEANPERSHFPWGLRGLEEGTPGLNLDDCRILSKCSIF